MSLVFQWTSFFCPAGKLGSQRQSLFCGMKKRATDENSCIWIAFLSLCTFKPFKVKPERHSSPVLHRLLSCNSLYWDLGHRRWLHISSAYKKHLAWSHRWMHVGLTCASTHGGDAALLISVFLCQIPSIHICWEQESERYNLYIYDTSVCVRVCCC